MGMLLDKQGDKTGAWLSLSTKQAALAFKLEMAREQRNQLGWL